MLLTTTSPSLLHTLSGFMSSHFLTRYYSDILSVPLSFPFCPDTILLKHSQLPWQISGLLQFFFPANKTLDLFKHPFPFPYTWVSGCSRGNYSNVQMGATTHL